VARSEVKVWAMGLKEELEERLNTALKAGEKGNVAVIRLTLSEIRFAEKEKRRPLEKEELEQILRSAVKKRKEAITLFRRGGRDDLADKEAAEIRLLEEYLPASLSAAELTGLVEEGLRETGAVTARDIGRVMKWIMPRLEGRADGSEVSRLVKERLTRSQ
jgi:uncharacterized protein YqeY